jgi:hypothetical protein
MFFLPHERFRENFRKPYNPFPIRKKISNLRNDWSCEKKRLENYQIYCLTFIKRKVSYEHLLAPKL